MIKPVTSQEDAKIPCKDCGDIIDRDRVVWCMNRGYKVTRCGRCSQKARSEQQHQQALVDAEYAKNRSYSTFGRS